MSEEEQRIAIAEACGWEYTPFGGGWKSPDMDSPDRSCKPPDYLSDLNAIREAKRQLLTTSDLCNQFNRTLIEEAPPRPVEFETDKWTWGQSAAVQSVALLKTLNLWTDPAPANK